MGSRRQEDERRMVVKYKEHAQALAEALWRSGCCTPGLTDRLLRKCRAHEAEHAESCALGKYLQATQEADQVLEKKLYEAVKAHAPELFEEMNQRLQEQSEEAVNQIDSLLKETQPQLAAYHQELRSRARAQALLLDVPLEEVDRIMDEALGEDQGADPE